MKIDQFKLSVRKTGNSYVCTLPMYLVKHFDIQTNDTLNIKIAEVIKGEKIRLDEKKESELDEKYKNNNTTSE